VNSHKGYKIESIHHEGDGVYTLKVISGMYSVLLYVYTADREMIALDKPVDVFITSNRWRDLKIDIRRIVEDMFNATPRHATVSYPKNHPSSRYAPD